ncbi:esterase [Salinimicrobium tongyeongense]|uniref:Esterase n=1 Tax=Salinimicrobium tongyeongense TaxID=2809707 RepID=A0ABY6NV87_9FLAO|nr:alpha/beta hydrolase-fold protein [Salinimicrobium tongyeongense]UZH56433.1 esterase [Salinimicrobium tongyeongense]
MKKLYIFTYLFLVVQLSFSQTLYKTINSSKLGEQRELKIQLPRNYEQNSDKIYPVIIVLDGDYLFEPMAGNVDYYSYWDEIPESIVVGVNQLRSRNDDCTYDPKNFLPEKKGAQFFEFLGMELLPFIDNNYRTSRFVAIAGHDITSNFINYYLFKPQPIFKAYINLSPHFAPEMSNRIAESLSKAESPFWFYLATGSNDVAELRKQATAFNQQMAAIKNNNLHYGFGNFEAANHYTLIANALPRALEHIFQTYKPINLEEYDKMIALEGSALDFLLEKYELIENNFGLRKLVRINDYLAVGKALEYREQWDELEKLGELAQKQYPNMALANYYLARSYEASGKTKKAMKTYQSAYGKEEVAFITIDFMLKKADLIKQDFGY